MSSILTPSGESKELEGITASNFHNVHPKTETIIKSKAKSSKKPQYSPTVYKLLNESDISHLSQIKWGVEHEKDGIKSFLLDIASQHKCGLEGFPQCGLYVKGDRPYLAAFPRRSVNLQMLWSSYSGNQVPIFCEA